MYISVSFIFIFEYHSVVWIYHHLFNYLPVDGHLGWFQLGAIMTKAAMNIYQVFGWTWFLFFNSIRQSVFNKKKYDQFFCLWHCIDYICIFSQTKRNNEVNLNSFHSGSHVECPPHTRLCVPFVCRALWTTRGIGTSEPYLLFLKKSLIAFCNCTVDKCPKSPWYCTES